jgi:beta-phosphoglucomutase
MKKAFILDLDGVICDTAVFHFEAWERLAQEYNYQLTEHDNEQLKGVSRVDSLKFILSKANHTISEEQFQLDLDRKNEWYLEKVAEMNQSHLLEGVTRFFEQCQIHQIPLGLGSASKNARLVLEKVGLINAFQAIVDASTVVNGKPHPETFLKAAELLGYEPENCIVFEDSSSGVTAAKSAKMFAVGIGKTEDLPLADYCIPNLGEFDFSNI